MAIEVCTCSEDPCAHSAFVAWFAEIIERERKAAFEEGQRSAYPPGRGPSLPAGHFGLSFEVDFGHGPIALRYLPPLDTSENELFRIFEAARDALVSKLEDVRGAKS